jgi:hypothetical protein
MISQWNQRGRRLPGETTGSLPHANSLGVSSSWLGWNRNCRHTKRPESRRTTIVELSQYVLEVLRRDEEFVLYRGEPSSRPGSPSVLLLASASMQPSLATLKKIEHEYSPRDELDSAWAVRRLAVSEQRGQTTLVLEDFGGETLNRFLSGPMEMTRFLRLAVGLATALGGLHRRELIQ